MPSGQTRGDSRDAQIRRHLTVDLEDWLDRPCGGFEIHGEARRIWLTSGPAAPIPEQATCRVEVCLIYGSPRHANRIELVSLHFLMRGGTTRRCRVTLPDVPVIAIASHEAQ